MGTIKDAMKTAELLDILDGGIPETLLMSHSVAKAISLCDENAVFAQSSMLICAYTCPCLVCCVCIESLATCNTLQPFTVEDLIVIFLYVSVHGHVHP